MPLQLPVPPLPDAAEKTYGLIIPWSHTDAELTKQFREWLRQLRPADCPEPKRAGRSSRSSAVSPIDMLHQLAAFRLEREGFTFLTASELEARKPYLSQKGWKRGVRAARDRIEKMAKVPFFQHSLSKIRK